MLTARIGFPRCGKNNRTAYTPVSLEHLQQNMVINTWFIKLVCVPKTLLECSKRWVLVVNELVELVKLVVWGQDCAVGTNYGGIWCWNAYERDTRRTHHISVRSSIWQDFCCYARQGNDAENRLPESEAKHVVEGTLGTSSGRISSSQDPFDWH
jgi:hypothetical protein